jgi:hypothetical protein
MQRQKATAAYAKAASDMAHRGAMVVSMRTNFLTWTPPWC